MMKNGHDAGYNDKKCNADPTLKLMMVFSLKLAWELRAALCETNAGDGEMWKDVKVPNNEVIERVFEDFAGSWVVVDCGGVDGKKTGNVRVGDVLPDVE
jgi:hypothetical protein